MPAGVIVKIPYTDHDHSGTSTGCTGKEAAVISQRGEEPKSRPSLFLGDGCKMKASYRTGSHLCSRYSCSDSAQVLLCPSYVTKAHMWQHGSSAGTAVACHKHHPNDGQREVSSEEAGRWARGRKRKMYHLNILGYNFWWVKENSETFDTIALWKTNSSPHSASVMWN